MPRDSVSVKSSSSRNKKRPVESDEEDEVEEQVEHPASEPASGEEEAGEEEEEYEIEKILNAKRGIFEDNPSMLGYFVKWKGYPTSDNSWVTEEDAAGAKELIEAYWENKKKEKSKSSSTARPKSAKPTPSRRQVVEASAEEDDEEEVIASISAPAPKKRGRSKQDKEEPMEIDDDEPAPRPKKSRKEESATAPAVQTKSKPKASKRKKEESESEASEEEDSGKVTIGNMNAYKNHKSWEEIVYRVDTVEKNGEAGELLVYFTLQSGLQPRHAMVVNAVAKEKFPQRMLSFYEANLKWRPVPEDDE